MADPLTGLGAAAAASQLWVYIAKTTDYLVELKVKIKDGPEEIHRQIVYVDQLVSILQVFIETPALHTTVGPSVESCLAQVGKIRVILQGVSFDGNDKSVRKLWNAIILGRKEKEILDLFQQLERKKTSLLLAVQIIDAKLLEKIGLQISKTNGEIGEVRIITEDMSSQITTVVAAIPAMASNIRIILHSLSTPTTQSTAPEQRKYFSVPNRRVRQFVGREDVLSKIEDRHSQSITPGTPKIVTISGLGGQGKTQIALEYCRRAQGSGVRAIFWIDSMSEANVSNSLKTISNLIKEPKEELLRLI